MNLICGINPVLEALGAGTRHFERLMIVKGIRNRRISEAIARASRLGVPLRFEARETLDRMAQGTIHQGIIAVVSAKPVMGLEDLLAPVQGPALLVVLDGVEDPRNLGAILRTAEAAGADGVLLPERHSAGLSETVARASAGALEHVRVARVGNVVQAIEALKSKGIWVVGFDVAGRERWDAVDYKRPVALVLGGEGKGIRRLVREHCDHLVALPLFGHVGSLNVSVAAGVALYEAVRQRGVVPSHVRPIPPRPNGGPRIVGPSPDDAELDPGRQPHAPPLPQPNEWVEIEDDEPLSILGVHEEPLGPTLVREKGRRRIFHSRPSGEPPLRGHVRRRGGPPRHGGAQHGPPGQPEAPREGSHPAGGAQGPQQEGSPRRRRRRRRR